MYTTCLGSSGRSCGRDSVYYSGLDVRWYSILPPPLVLHRRVSMEEKAYAISILIKTGGAQPLGPQATTTEKFVNPRTKIHVTPRTRLIWI